MGNIQFFCFYIFLFSQWWKKDLLNSECGSLLHLHLKLEVPSMFSIPRWKHLRGTYAKIWNLRGDQVSRLIELGWSIEPKNFEKKRFVYLNLSSISWSWAWAFCPMILGEIRNSVLDLFILLCGICTTYDDIFLVCRLSLSRLAVRWINKRGFVIRGLRLLWDAS